MGNKTLKNKVDGIDASFQALVENLMDGVAICDEEGFHLYVNSKFTEITGYSSEELKNISAWQFTKPEDQKKLKKRMKERLAGKTVPSKYERIIIRKDGEEIPVELSTTTTMWRGIKRPMAIVRDLRKNIEAEERYKDLVEKAGIAILIDDKKGHITYFNQRLCEIFGYSEDEIKNMSIDTLVHPDEVAVVMKHHKNRLKGKDAPRSYEFRGIRKDGETIYLEAETILLEKRRKVEGTRSYLWDRTSIKVAEKKLKERESQIRNIMENSTNLFYSHTSDHVLTYLSPQVEQILGYSVKEAMVKWTEFTSDHPINEIGFNYTIKAIETGERQPPYELELVRKDRRKIWVEVREFPHVVNGKTVSISGSLTEITERKNATEALIKSEEQFRLIAENTADNIAITTFDHRVKYLYVSPSLESVIGMKEKDLLGRSFFDFVHPEDKKVIFPLLKNYVAMRLKKLFSGEENKISEMIEYRFKNKAGEWRDFQSTVTIIGDNLLSVTRDITEQKRDRAEILKLKEGLEKEVEAKTKELREKVNDLQRFVDATVERELRMKELFEENEKLKAELKKKSDI